MNININLTSAGRLAVVFFYLKAYDNDNNMVYRAS